MHDRGPSGCATQAVGGPVGAGPGHAYHPWNQYVLLPEGRSTCRPPRSGPWSGCRPTPCTPSTSTAPGSTMGRPGASPTARAYDTLDLTRPAATGGERDCGRSPTSSAHRRSSGCTGAPAGSCSTGWSSWRATSGARSRCTTPAGWLVRPAKSLAPDDERGSSMQLGFQEHFDADADPAGWTDRRVHAATEAEGWKPYRQSWGPVGTCTLAADGAAGRAAVGRPRRIVRRRAGSVPRRENPRGYKVAEDVYHLVDPEEVPAQTAM